MRNVRFYCQKKATLGELYEAFFPLEKGVGRRKAPAKVPFFCGVQLMIRKIVFIANLVCGKQMLIGVA